MLLSFMKKKRYLKPFRNFLCQRRVSISLKYVYSDVQCTIILSRPMFLSGRNQSINFQCKSFGWFLCSWDIDLKWFSRNGSAERLLYVTHSLYQMLYRYLLTLKHFWALSSEKHYWWPSYHRYVYRKRVESKFLMLIFTWIIPFWCQKGIYLFDFYLFKVFSLVTNSRVFKLWSMLCGQMCVKVIDNPQLTI